MSKYWPGAEPTEEPGMTVQWAYGADGEPKVLVDGEEMDPPRARSVGAQMTACAERAELMSAVATWLAESGCAPEQVKTAVMELNKRTDQDKVLQALTPLVRGL